MDTYAPRTLREAHKQSQNARRLATSSSTSSSSKQQQNQDRSDGRATTQMRPTFLQVGLMSEAAGSAYVERAGTKVICAIYGPRASKKFSTPFSERGQFIVDFKYAPFAQKHRRGKRTGAAGAALEAEEKEMQQLLTEATAVSIQLEAFPKAVLEAYVQVLQDEGGVFSASIMCISLALADAGIRLYDLVTACEAISLNDRLLVDPSTAENERCSEGQSQDIGADGESDATTATSASLHLAYMPSLKQITCITQTGTCQLTQVKQLTNYCIAGCEQLNGLMRECLIEAAKKKI